MTEEDAAVRKKLAFDGLYALSDDNDEDEDTGLLASLRTLEGKTLGDPTVPSSRRSRRTGSNLTRSLSLFTPTPATGSERRSDPRRVTAKQLLDEVSSAVKDTPTLAQRHTNDSIEAVNQSISVTTMPSSSAPPPSSAIPRIGSKRKRDAPINTVPEDQQIFRDLHFYFFPNNDTNSGRAKRIIKALEYGATWQKDWNDSITHIVADKGIKFGDLLRHLKLGGLPTGVSLVNEEYPSSCLDFRRLLDPLATEFGVDGYIAPSPNPVTDIPKNTSQQTDVSLQLKPIRKSARLQETPSSTGDSLGISSPTNQSVRTEQPDIGEENPDADELDIAIREARDSERIALGSDYDEDINTDSLSEIGSGPDRSKRPKTSNWQDRFQCMHKHTGPNDKGPNVHTMSILQELAEYYTQTHDQWRSKSYRQAIAALRKHPTKVNSKAEAMQIHGIGDSIAEKIEEIVVTNRLRKLDYTKLDERQQVLQRFMKIYGVGFNIAEKWVSAGHKTLEDLLSKVDLTTNQRIGIEHYDEFNTRVPRAEVERHASTVKTALKSLDPLYRAYTMGSYRRGAETSGDIDILITKPGARMEDIRTTVLDRLVPDLTKSGFLVAALAQTSQADGSKWHGASCLPGGMWRRIDFLLVPDSELGAALLYFTGNDIFNRSLRLLASKKGMRLNQRGLYRDVLRGLGREKLSEGTLVEGRDERKIFEALGVPWRPPEHRIC